MNEDDLPTRASLVIRLGDHEDREAWEQFSEIYTPLIYGYCMKRGLARPDAADVSQDVLRSLSLALKKGQYDPKRGKFRAWLFTSVRNAISTYYQKQKRRPLTLEESTLIEHMGADAGEDEAVDWERDYQSQVLSWAIEKVRPEFAERIWRAFEGTAIEELPAKEVSREIDMTPNAVWVARHRVIKRLKQLVESIDADDWEQEMIRSATRAM